MTIRRGEDWGRPGRPPADLIWFADDASAARAVDEGAREIGLGGGDMARTLGASAGTRGGVDVTGSAVSFPIDLIEVTSVDGRRAVALAHVVIRHRRWRWWRGSIVAVMNAQFIGRWDVAPRGHPNDGRFEAVEVDSTMSIRQRFLAGRRLPTGSHVPHPLVRVRSSAELTIPVPRWAKVLVDGRPFIDRPSRTSSSSASSSSSSSSSFDHALTVRVVPDAFVAWIAGVR